MLRYVTRRQVDGVAGVACFAAQPQVREGDGSAGVRFVGLDGEADMMAG